MTLNLWKVFINEGGKDLNLHGTGAKSRLPKMCHYDMLIISELLTMTAQKPKKF